MYRYILPFHFASGEGVIPYIGHIGMYNLKGYGFKEILARNRGINFGHFGQYLRKSYRTAPPIIFPGVTPPPAPHAHSALRVEGTVVPV